MKFAGENTDLEILVRHLLVLLRHRGRGRVGAETGGTEEDGRGDDAVDGVPEDLPALAGWGLGPRTVGAEGDVVSCWC